MSAANTALPIIWFVLAVAALALGAAALLCVWVYRDAKARGLEAWVWTLVVLLSSGVGLIIYFLVGRKEARKICPACGKSIPAPCAYCGYCGAPVDRAEAVPARGGGKGALIAAAACLSLSVLLAVGFAVGMTARGAMDWTPSVSTVYNSNSIGDKWNVSWHYTNKTSSHSFKLTKNGPETLYFEGNSGEGPLVFRVFQGDAEQTFDLSGEGMSGSLDLSIFEPGRVYLELDNNKGEGKNVRFTSHWE